MWSARTYKSIAGASMTLSVGVGFLREVYIHVYVVNRNHFAERGHPCKNEFFPFIIKPPENQGRPLISKVNGFTSLVTALVTRSKSLPPRMKS